MAVLDRAVPVIAALVVIYAIGYVSGALLIAPGEDRPPLGLGVVRLVSGLFLSATAFLLSLAVGIPWFVGPGVLLACALWRHRTKALIAPRAPVVSTWSQAVTAAVALILQAPVLTACWRMARGSYPPVFFNVDTPYFLEKVHELVAATTLPPSSLSVLDGKFAYHYGVNGIAALISRSSGLAPHLAVFLLVLPLLAAAIIAAAMLAADAISPAVPAILAVPLLLVSAPTLWHPFWQHVAPALQQALASASAQPLVPLGSNYELWGVAAITGQNLATQFLVLAAVGGIAAAPARGWRHPIFLIGSAVLFKAPTGVALVGGFSAMETWEAARTRRVQPLLRVAAAAGVFAVVYSTLWMLPRLPVAYRTELSPLFQLKFLEDQGRLPGFIADLAWLLLPIAVVWPVRRERSQRSVLPLLAFAIAPLVIVNVLRANDLRPGRGIDYDWLQLVLCVPILLHASVLALAGSRWGTISTARRAVFAGVVALSVIPAAVSAAQYGRVALLQPEAGHEFVDNRAIAAALEAIPVRHSIVVTNDLRYPAEGFSRDYRQMQIPALFGHQAFAVNYAYEAYDFSRDRLALQGLLQAEDWTPAIDDAARKYGWTHLLVRKDYPHPRVIPLPEVFDSPFYAVFRFGPTG